MGHDHHGRVLQVSGDHVVGPSTEPRHVRPGAQPIPAEPVEGVGTHQRDGQIGPGRGQLVDQVHVESVGVQRAHVHGVGAGRQIGWSGPGPLEVLDVDRVRDHREVRAQLGAGGGQPGRADDHPAALGEQLPLLVGHPFGRPRPVPRARPVVGDVVDRGPARLRGQPGVRRVVHPQRWLGEPEPLGAMSDLAAQRPVGHRPGPTWPQLEGLQSHDAPVLGPGPQTGLAPPSRPSPALVQGIERRLDEQHPARRVEGQQLTHEELVAAPDVVPGLQRAHHQIGAAARRAGQRVVVGHACRSGDQQPGGSGHAIPVPSSTGRIAQQQGPGGGSDQLGQAQAHQGTPTVVLGHEQLGAAGEVLVGQRFDPVRAGPAHVGDHGAVDHHHPPAGLVQASAQVGLLGVEPEPQVEPAQRLERGSAHQQAGADDEAGLAGAPRPAGQAVEPERLDPRPSS